MYIDRTKLIQIIIEQLMPLEGFSALAFDYEGYMLWKDNEEEYRYTQYSVPIEEVGGEFTEWLELACEMIDGIEIEYDWEELNSLGEQLERPTSSELLIVDSEEKGVNRYFINLFKKACEKVNSSEIYIDESGEINFLIKCDRCEKYFNQSYEFAHAPYDDKEHEVFNKVIDQLGVVEHSIKHVLRHIEWCRCKK